MPIINSFSLTGCHHRHTELGGGKRGGDDRGEQEGSDRGSDRGRETRKKGKNDGGGGYVHHASVTGVRDEQINALHLNASTRSLRKSSNVYAR